MLAIIVSTLLFAAEIPSSTSLSSSHAAYDGNALILTGHVVLDHGLGKMHAEHASLQKQEMGSDFPFTWIELKKDVVLDLKNQAKLSCANANLDFILLKGYLFSEENTPVIFSDIVKKKFPITLTSQDAEITFSKHEEEGKKTDYDLETILAKENVVFEYNHDYLLYADKALYRKTPSQDQKVQGFIIAYPKDDTSFCRLVHGNDVIEATRIEFDLLQGKISMKQSQGTLSSSFFPSLIEKDLSFQSEHLLWDENKNTLLFTGKTYIAEQEVGDIASEEELRLVYTQKEGKNFLKTLRTRGKATLHYNTHRLISFGPLSMDRSKLTTTLESPEIDGAVPQEQQLCYQEGDVTIYADKGHVEYALFEGQIHPASVTLKDNIRLFSKTANQQRRWALADKITYSPDTRTFILTATPGKKVLFRDEEEIAISAQEVHVTYDPFTKQEKIQGVGKVQLSFSTDEINLLKKMFPTYE